jgi:protein-disulfide isomerase
VFTLLGAAAAIFLGAHLAASTLEESVPFDQERFLAEYRSQPLLDAQAGDSPRMGFQGDNPPLQLVEFADFQCPGCGMAARRMHHLLKTYGDKIQVVFKNFPLDSSCNPHIKSRLHEHACAAAKAAHCAHKQGKFEVMYEKLFQNQRELSQAILSDWAAELKLDKAAFEACLASPEAEAAVQKDIAQAHTLGLVSTPTFYVAGRKVEGMIDENRLRALLKELGK